MELDNFHLEQAARLFSDATNIHGDLPPAYSYWSSQYVDNRLEGLFGARTSESFYAICISELCRTRRDGRVRIASIGCGEGLTEIQVCKQLLQIGHREILFECVDIAAGAIERAVAAAAAAGLSDYISFRVETFDEIIKRQFDVFIANQVLHHIVDLERVFDCVKRSIGHDGIFLSCDMIGRNGHMLWPEALMIADRLWEGLPRKYKLNHVLNRYEGVYSNWDNSKEANEGVRAQDILPLLLRRFHFTKFFAAGNLTIALFGRHFGANFSPDEPSDRAVIDQVSRLDFDLIDIGYLKPMLMFASMSNQPSECIHFRHWSPQFCARVASPLDGIIQAQSYEFGQTIKFTERAAVNDWLVSGWSSVEPGGVWSNAESSLIRIPLAPDVVARRLRIDITGLRFPAPGLPPLTIGVIVNGRCAGDITFREKQNALTTSLFVPDVTTEARTLTILLNYSDTWIPSDLGMSVDIRRLAFHLTSLRIIDVPANFETGPTDGASRRSHSHYWALRLQALWLRRSRLRRGWWPG
jgi:2-polyprenyl-3-methyl-5-hydroxy-6-metoxy-1,4-benzoquinol methylase